MIVDLTKAADWFVTDYQTIHPNAAYRYRAQQLYFTNSTDIGGVEQIRVGVDLIDVLFRHDLNVAELTTLVGVVLLWDGKTHVFTGLHPYAESGSERGYDGGPTTCVSAFIRAKFEVCI